MELKQRLASLNKLARELLIVPYGIETLIALMDCIFLVILLIVPYGIETIIIN